MKLSPKILAGVLAVVGCSSAFASLTTFQTYSGANYGVSTSGWGSSGESGTILTSIPSGATLVSAYLYSAYNFATSPTVALGGTAVNFTQNNPNATACCQIGSVRADVTSIVAAAYATAGNPTTAFGLTVDEGNNSGGTDGEELVTVYKYASGADNTVAILDGFASVTGDTATLTLGTPFAAGDTAQMMLGDGFSCGIAAGCSSDQASTVTVNGTLITQNAGGNDDCTDPSAATAAANGCLITVGTNLNDGGTGSDPFSPFLPTYLQDHERYDLTPEIGIGNTSITVDTANASQDDNIFAAVFKVSGDVTVVSGTPEPSTWLLFGTGLIGLGLARRFRRAHSN